MLSSTREAVAHWPLLALVASLALVAGAAVAITGLRNTRTFTSLEDVEASLRIPVIGVISNEGVAVVHQPRASRLLRGLVFLSELSVAVFVFAITALAINNMTFLSDLLTDPVSGFARYSAADGNVDASIMLYSPPGELPGGAGDPYRIDPGWSQQPPECRPFVSGVDERTVERQNKL